ncbi:N-acetyltransferase [Marinimicrobium sp. ABcell2]|uniref:GNAT family N-acetyltransferase n=1 Tax=Marinimicrobium sp. ABcell2 TaxID=3069751 RepID=UPI0027B1A518|nr:N-acetyltransferase [Marinimicrobium sp. ABcell2]MDQ2075907.1 N-acetyltransferase [Marinimicrobium sp. ABcell2]
MATEVVNTSASDVAPVISTIVLAFASDPMMRWSWPNAHQYLAVMPSFVEAFGGKAFNADTAHCTSDRRGAALWLPPGTRPDEEAMAKIAEKSVTPERLEEIYGVMEKMDRYHPNEPYWYLPLIGVDPSQQGKGYGAALLDYALRQCDKEGQLAYLDSSNPRNIPLYERHGFHVVGEIQHGSSPTMRAMIREPQR